MNIIVPKKRFLKSLSYAEAIASSKTTIPVLSNILIDVHDNQLSITSSNLETGIKINDSVKAVEEGSLAVNCKKLLSIVRELPDDDIRLVTDEHKRLTIRSMSDQINAQFTIAGVAKEDFPEVKTEPEGEYVSLNAEQLKHMIRKVIFAISSDENKYALTGVFFEKVNDTFSMVATDGKRLALISRSADELGISNRDFQIPYDGVIVPKMALNEILKYSFEKNELSVGFSRNQIFFHYDDVRLASNLIEGKYPEYKKIIPVERERWFIAERMQLMNAIKRVSVLVDESYNQIKLHIVRDSLILSSQNPALGGAVEEIPIQYNGEEIDIALNYVYLMDCLREIESERIKLDFENSEKVITVKGEDEKDYINLIMPMKLNI